MDHQQQTGASVEASPPGPSKGMAIAAMVLGIVAVASAPLAPLLTPGSVLAAVVGLILGLMAMRAARRSPATYAGRGHAIAGVVLSAFALVATALVVWLFIAVRDTVI